MWGPRRWHRYLGAVLALPLLWLCVTGLLLQHQERLGLGERRVNSAWLLERYKQIPAGEPRVAAAGRFTVANWGGLLFLDDVPVEESGHLVGAVAKPAELVVATESELLVYDAQGEFLDRLDEASLPGIPVKRLGLDAAGRVLLAVEGGATYATEDFLAFEQVPGAREARWSSVAAAPEERGRLERRLAEAAGIHLGAGDHGFAQRQSPGQSWEAHCGPDRFRRDCRDPVRNSIALQAELNLIQL